MRTLQFLFLWSAVVAAGIGAAAAMSSAPLF